MRALVIHLGEGSTHILLASTRRQDLEAAPTPRTFLFESRPPQEEEHHNRLFVMHDEQIRNGADLSLRYLGHLQDELRVSMLRQAAETLDHFRSLAEVVTVAVSASLLTSPRRPAEDPLVADFQQQLGVDLHVLTPQDEGLWMLRGVRGIYPSGELACVAPGFWRSLGVWEEPGRVPRLLDWEAGTSRMPEGLDQGGERLFPGFRAPPGQPLFISGEHAWLLGALQLGLTFHDLDLLDEAEWDAAGLRKLEELLAGLSVPERNLIPMVGQHGDSLLEALRLCRRLLAESGGTRVRVCSRGLTHGLASHLFYEGRRS
ncbi:MAG: hypothetical protein WC326_12370 [Candidatus Delongbacteria bacterium]